MKGLAVPVYIIAVLAMLSITNITAAQAVITAPANILAGLPTVLTLTNVGVSGSNSLLPFAVIQWTITSNGVTSTESTFLSNGASSLPYIFQSPGSYTIEANVLSYAITVNSPPVGIEMYAVFNGNTLGVGMVGPQYASPGATNTVIVGPAISSNPQIGSTQFPINSGTSCLSGTLSIPSNIVAGQPTILSINGLSCSGTTFPFSILQWTIGSNTVSSFVSNGFSEVPYVFPTSGNYPISVSYLTPTIDISNTVSSAAMSLTFNSLPYYLTMSPSGSQPIVSGYANVISSGATYTTKVISLSGGGITGNLVMPEYIDAGTPVIFNISDLSYNGNVLPFTILQWNIGGNLVNTYVSNGITSLMYVFPSAGNYEIAVNEINAELDVSNTLSNPAAMWAYLDSNSISLLNGNSIMYATMSLGPSYEIGSGSLTVNPALEIPSITSPAATNTLDEGQPITISASVSGGTAPYTYKFIVSNERDPSDIIA
ncbi:MAG: hypothetical protein ACP5HW_03545, partial [Candidatus Micrarchaeia archaeon]